MTTNNDVLSMAFRVTFEEGSIDPSRIIQSSVFTILGLPKSSNETSPEKIPLSPTFPNPALGLSLAPPFTSSPNLELSMLSNFTSFSNPSNSSLSQYFVLSNLSSSISSASCVSGNSLLSHQSSPSLVSSFPILSSGVYSSGGSRLGALPNPSAEPQATVYLAPPTAYTTGSYCQPTQKDEKLLPEKLPNSAASPSSSSLYYPSTTSSYQTPGFKKFTNLQVDADYIVQIYRLENPAYVSPTTSTYHFATPTTQYSVNLEQQSLETLKPVGVSASMPEREPTELADLDRHSTTTTTTTSPYTAETLVETKIHQHLNYISPPTGSVSPPNPEIIHNCVFCCYPIREQYYLQVMNESYHEFCLRCVACQHPLSSRTSCYAKNGHFYCKDCHAIIFSQKCARCQAILLPSDLIYKAMHLVYHAACFTCYFCQMPFSKGDEYVMLETEICCQKDFEAMKTTESVTSISNGVSALPPPQAQPPVGSLPPGLLAHMNDYSYPHTELSGMSYEFETDCVNRKTPKRPRTILNAVQRRQFKLAFEKSSKPCRKVREQLAKETGLSVRVVQVWFQNQRAKMKKIQRKEDGKRPATAGTTNSEGKTEGSKSTDEEADSDCESERPMPAIGVQRITLLESANPIQKLTNMNTYYFSNYMT